MKKPNLGKTGNFPRGKFSEDDEGEFCLGMTVKDKTLIINFGTPVVWFGLDLNAAEAFAEMLAKHINTLKGAQWPGNPIL